ncbi:hypothetical protein Rwratislav_35799 [Rhodococcus wratislaviensis IFP 2016]|nr:hypothetical protein Rwratislav_35799 [Rhodococcus wratislaviensis IFP 2016]
MPHHRDWGTDTAKRKGGDYFDAKSLRRYDIAATTALEASTSTLPSRCF